MHNLGFKRVFVVPEGLNVEPVTDIPRKATIPVCIYVGRLKKVKRLDHALSAFSMINERIHNVELWIVGDGYYRDYLEKKACDGIKFFGYVSHRRKIELLKKAWLLIHPSIREGWGLNVIEANACGTPTIAYDVLGLRDSIRNRETGLLVESGDVRALAEMIMKIIENKGLREQFSRNALNYSKQFDWDRAAREFLRILEILHNE